MGLLFSRVGSDSYYSGLDKSLSKMKKDVDQLKAGKARRRKFWSTLSAQFLAGFVAIYACVLAYVAWVFQQPPHTYTSTQHAKRVSIVFIIPLTAYALYQSLAWVVTMLDKKADKQIAAVEARLRKTVTAIKDSTRYEQTQKLLRQYDPDYRPPVSPLPLPSATGGVRGGGGGKRKSGAMTLAANTVHGAGAQVLPVLSQLWSYTANTLIADDPVMLKLAGEAQQQAANMQNELFATKAYVHHLELENNDFREKLGLPLRELMVAEDPSSSSLSPIQQPPPLEQHQHQPLLLPEGEQQQQQQADEQQIANDGATTATTTVPNANETVNPPATAAIPSKEAATAVVNNTTMTTADKKRESSSSSEYELVEPEKTTTSIDAVVGGSGSLVKNKDI